MNSSGSIRSGSSKQGFTLIELLVVIVIIGILMGLIMAVTGVVRRSGETAQTRAIMHATLLAVTMASSSGVNIAPVVHPLANTAVAPYSPLVRSQFFRGEAIAGLYTIGQPVDLVGEALVVSDPTTVAMSEIGRVMRPTDVYGGSTTSTDTDCPLIFGMQRRKLTVLGSGLGLQEFRALPPIDPASNDLNHDGVLDTPPYIAQPPSGVRYSDQVCQRFASGDITSDTALEVENTKLFDFILGPETVGELASLGGLRTAVSGQTPLISNFRLRNAKEYNGQALPNWDTNLMKKVSICRDLDSQWKAYRLRGTGIYDVWGHEVLFYLADNGGFSMLSAGPDGLFRFNPGINHTYETNAFDANPTTGTDDIDATKDNILIGQN